MAKYAEVAAIRRAAEAHRDTIDRLLVATVTPDHPSPATAPLVQHALGLERIPRLVVCNKADRLDPRRAAMIAHEHDGVAVSARDRRTLEPVLRRLERMLSEVDERRRALPDEAFLDGPDELDDDDALGELDDEALEALGRAGAESDLDTLGLAE